jgi:hypothetical protein
MLFCVFGFIAKALRFAADRCIPDVPLHSDLKNPHSDAVVALVCWLMLFRIIYCSRSRCTAGEASSLLDHSRINNARLGVTGALYLSDGRFAQCLEGEEEVVNKLYQRVLLDRRHTECKLLDQRPISGRVYAGWSMAWLPESTCASLLMRTLVLDSDRSKLLDGSSIGAFFYAMAHTGECR